MNIFCDECRHKNILPNLRIKADCTITGLHLIRVFDGERDNFMKSHDCLLKTSGLARNNFSNNP